MANINQRQIRKSFRKAQKKEGNGKPFARPTTHPAHGRKTNVGDPSDKP